MRYIVDPGLYALGNPDAQAPILVTANYKMSFDRLRQALTGRHAWILVVDTNGINVWCAAGKGSFGTTGLVRRIRADGLDQVVTHRTLILPQLAGPGVAAHDVKKMSGFRVVYGPIRAEDLPSFLDQGFRATLNMRKKSFTLWVRIVLIPVDLMGALIAVVIVSLCFFFVSGLGSSGSYWANALDFGLFACVALFAAVAAGAVLTPLLLPWLPGRAFALKGLFPGLLAALMLALYRVGNWGSWVGSMEILGWFFMVPAISAYLAMNFTGSSTYTSLSGVRKEMKWAVPLEITAGIIGLALWLGSRFAT
jgi:acetyl-CoA decarbonylase/synthase complex subunit gamma